MVCLLEDFFFLDRKRSAKKVTEYITLLGSKANPHSHVS